MDRVLAGLGADFSALPPRPETGGQGPVTEDALVLTLDGSVTWFCGTAQGTNSAPILSTVTFCGRGYLGAVCVPYNLRQKGQPSRESSTHCCFLVKPTALVTISAHGPLPARGKHALASCLLRGDAECRGCPCVWGLSSPLPHHRPEGPAPPDTHTRILPHTHTLALPPQGLLQGPGKGQFPPEAPPFRPAPSSPRTHPARPRCLPSSHAKQFSGQQAPVQLFPC